MSMETAVLDPKEFISGRIELALDRLGIAVRDVDWGDSEHEVFLMKRAIGEVPADRHPPNRKVTFKLRAKTEPTKVTLAEAAYKLQQKVGTLQDKGGWIRRDMNSEHGFAQSVGAIVHSAVLGGIQGWFMAHREIAPEITLTLTISPYFYRKFEVESAETKEEAKREVIYTDENKVGTARGLQRVRFNNLNSEAHYNAVIWAEECEDAPANLADATAKLMYEAKELTLRGGSKELGSGIVESVALTNNWFTVLSSKITASGHMTHKGNRRIIIRAQDPSGTIGSVEWKIRYRVLGSPVWNEDNVAVVSTVKGEYQLYDLGEVRLEQAVLGNDRWEFEIQARSNAGAVTLLNKVYPLPTEQFAIVRSTSAIPSADSLSKKSPATAANEDHFGHTEWVNPTKVVSSNNEYATVTAPVGTAIESDWLRISNFGFAIPEGATITGIVVGVERQGKYGGGATENTLAYDADAYLAKAGVIQSSGPGKDKAVLYDKWSATEMTKEYGSASDLWANTWTPAEINHSGFGFAFRVVCQSGTGSPECVARVDHVWITVYYTTEGGDQQVCYAGRAMEFRSDGAYRQHKTEDVWGKLVPDGSLPYHAPPGLEGKPSRGILIPSRGDLVSVADDSAVNKMGTKRIARPAYHFTSEAS